jgi:hypothetical protein
MDGRAQNVLDLVNIFVLTQGEDLELESYFEAALQIINYILDGVCVMPLFTRCDRVAPGLGTTNLLPLLLLFFL